MVSKKQEEILNYIDKTIKSNGYSPTVREICEAVGLKSTSTVQYLSLIHISEPTRPY